MRESPLIRAFLSTWAAVCAVFAARTAEARGIWLEAGTLTASIATELEAEGQPLAAVQDDADTLARVVRTDGRIDVEVVARSGATIVDRRVEIDRGLEPALRVVVLLIADAVSGLTGPWPGKALPPRADGDPNPSGEAEGTQTVGAVVLPASPRPVVISGGVEFDTWGSLQPGLYVGLHRALFLDDLMLGTRIVFTGIQGGTIDGANGGGMTAISGTQKSVSLFLDGEWTPFGGVSGFRAGLLGGVGGTIRVYSWQPAVIPAMNDVLPSTGPMPQGVAETSIFPELSVRMGPMFEYAPGDGHFAVRLSGGPLVHVLHGRLQGTATTVDPYPVQVWFEGGLAYRIF